VLKVVKFLFRVGSAALSPLGPLPLGGSLGLRSRLGFGLGLGLLSLLAPSTTLLLADGGLGHLGSCSLGLGNSFRLAASRRLNGNLFDGGRSQGRIGILGLLSGNLGHLLGGLFGRGFRLGFRLRLLLGLGLRLLLGLGLRLLFILVGITMLRAAGGLGMVDGREAGSDSGSSSRSSGGLVLVLVLRVVLAFMFGSFMFSGFLAGLVSRVGLLPLGEFGLVKLRPSLRCDQRQVQSAGVRGILRSSPLATMPPSGS
jgi:hypothetical protein